MACCLQVLSRFVPARFAPRRAATVPTSCLTSTTNESESSHSNTRHDPVDFVLNGIPTRVLNLDYRSLPSHRHSNEYFLRLCQPLQGFQYCSITTYVHHLTLVVLQVAKVEFDTETNATRGARLLHNVAVNDLPISVRYCPNTTEPVLDEFYSDYDILMDPSSLVVMEEDAISQPARKKAKLETPLLCRICVNPINSPYSKPCLRCKKAWCLDCVKTWFTMATQDFERMPARCCNVVMHHGVAGGILSTVDFEAYKLKYDEHTTANPLYCPVPTCSTFIPPRLIDSTQSTVDCTVCTTRICTKCKQLSAPGHICEEETAVIQIKAFNYKICPKCGTGVMKMYGCPHVRCACGAHVCWDCMRALAVCYRSPCTSAIADGQYGDDEYDESTDSEGDVEDAGTSMEISDAQHANLVSGGTVPVSLTATLRGAQAVLHIFRGRHRRGGDVEERRRALPGIARLERDTTPERPPVVNPSSLLEAMAGELSPTMATPVATPATEEAPLEAATPVIPDDSERDIPSSAHEEGLCLTEDSNNTIINLPTGGDPEQPAPFPNTAALHSTTQPGIAYAANAADFTGSALDLYIASHPFAPALPSASSSNTNLNESSFGIRANPAVTPPAPPSFQNLDDSIPLNLDDPTLTNWEASPLDFGDEPIDESFDVWGCACTFSKLRTGDVDPRWMELKYLDCMKCFGGLVLFPSTSGGGGVKRSSEKDKLAWHCCKCGVVVCGKCKGEKRGVMKGLMMKGEGEGATNGNENGIGNENGNENGNGTVFPVVG